MLISQRTSTTVTRIRSCKAYRKMSFHQERRRCLMIIYLSGTSFSHGRYGQDAVIRFGLLLWFMDTSSRYFLSVINKIIYFFVFVVEISMTMMTSNFVYLNFSTLTIVSCFVQLLTRFWKKQAGCHNSQAFLFNLTVAKIRFELMQHRYQHLLAKTECSVYKKVEIFLLPTLCCW